MASASHTSVVSNPRAAALAARHSAVEAQIHELSQHPSTPDFEINKLKRLKLRLKEQMRSE